MTALGFSPEGQAVSLLCHHLCFPLVSLVGWVVLLPLTPLGRGVHVKSDWASCAHRVLKGLCVTGGH